MCLWCLSCWSFVNRYSNICNPKCHKEHQGSSSYSWRVRFYANVIDSECPPSQLCRSLGGYGTRLCLAYCCLTFPMAPEGALLHITIISMTLSWTYYHACVIQ
jgi:hypothetical protein